MTYAKANNIKEQHHSVMKLSNLSVDAKAIEAKNNNTAAIMKSVFIDSFWPS